MFSLTEDRETVLSCEIQKCGVNMISVTQTQPLRLTQLRKALQDHRTPIWYVIARIKQKNPNKGGRIAYEPFKKHGFVAGGSKSGLTTALRMNTWNFENKEPVAFSNAIKRAMKHAGPGHSGKAPSLFKQFYKVMKKGDIVFVTDPTKNRFLIGLVQSSVKFTTKLAFEDALNDDELIHYRDCDWIVECKLTELGMGTDGRLASLPAQRVRSKMMSSPATLGRIFLPPGNNAFNNRTNFTDPLYWRKELQRMMYLNSTITLKEVTVKSQLKSERPSIDMLSKEIYDPSTAKKDQNKKESDRSRRARRGSSSSSSSNSSSSTSSSSSSSSSSSNNGTHATGRKVKVQIEMSIPGTKERYMRWFPGTTDVKESNTKGKTLLIHWWNGDRPSKEKRDAIRTLSASEWDRLVARMDEDSDDDGADEDEEAVKKKKMSLVHSRKSSSSSSSSSSSRQQKSATKATAPVRKRKNTKNNNTRSTKKKKSSSSEDMKEEPHAELLLNQSEDTKPEINAPLSSGAQLIKHLRVLSQMREKGDLTDEEFKLAKQKILQ